MSINTIAEIKRLFFSLEIEDQKKLHTDLQINEDIPRNQIFDFKQPEHCANCKSKRIIKHSIYKGIQRHKCKDCGRTFSARTGTVLAHLKKEAKFCEYVELVEKFGLLTLKKVSNTLEISNQTSLDWRHKYLMALDKKKDKFIGDVQADDIWFLYSQKGRKGLEYSRKRGGSKRKGDNDFQVKVLVLSDQNKSNWSDTVKIGRINTQDVITSIGDKFVKNQKIISDKHPTYGAFAKSIQLNWVNFKSSNHVAQTGENVQYVNSLASQLKSEINHLHRGIATKNLDIYANYVTNDKKKVTLNDLIKSDDCWYKFIAQEDDYKKFINRKSKRTYRCPTKRSWKYQQFLN